MAFKPAARRNAKLRLAITGPAGSGKTYTAIMIAKLLNARVAVADSERGSAEKYARPAGKPEGPGAWDFDHDQVTGGPHEFRSKILEAAQAGYPVLVVDSYSHSWMGALETIDKLGGWVKGGKVISPAIARLVDAILTYPGHVVATMRSVTDNVIEQNDKGRATIRKVGMKSVARDGTDYEFDVILDLTTDGGIAVTKTRCSALAGKVFSRDEDVPKIVDALKGWLDEGAPLTPREALAEKIRFASTSADLQALLPELKSLEREDQVALKPVYLGRKDEIADTEGLE